MLIFFKRTTKTVRKRRLILVFVGHTSEGTFSHCFISFGTSTAQGLFSQKPVQTHEFWACFQKFFCIPFQLERNILRKSTSGRHRPVRYPDGPMTARYRFLPNRPYKEHMVCVVFQTHGQGQMTDQDNSKQIIDSPLFRHHLGLNALCNLLKFVLLFY